MRLLASSTFFALLFAAGCGDASVDPTCDDGVGGDQCDRTTRGPCEDQGGDADGDTVCDPIDNCPAIRNVDQTDTDDDGVGDACSPVPADTCAGLGGDEDSDDWCSLYDNCPNTANFDQSDTDDDGVGDVCDVEECDGADNDGDGLIDEGFADDDDDGVANCADACPGNPDIDTDFDGIADCVDACPLDPLNDQDGDRACGDVDNCPLTANGGQGDRDGDGVGDACDIEECDGISNDADSLVDEGLPDEDDDGVCDDIDPCADDPLNDPDLDEVCGLVDNCPGIANADQTDSDGDGWGDACDLDAPVHCDAPASLMTPGAVPLPTNLDIGGIAAAAGDDTFYVGVRSTSPMFPNSIIAVDGPTESVLWATFVGSEPDAMALADDGSYLYVDLDGAAQVRVVDLPTRRACRSFAVGNDSIFGPLRAGDMGVLPGAPESVVISTRRSMLVFDHGFPRPVTANTFSGPYALEVASDSVVYAYNNNTTEFGFRELAITATGLTETWVQGDLISFFNTDIVYDSGRVYATSGPVVDVATRGLAGTIAANGAVALEASIAEAFFLTDDSVVSVYDTNTLAFKREIVLPGALNGFSDQTLLRWGTAGLVAANEDTIVIIDQAFP